MARLPEEILDRYLRGTASAEEQRMVELAYNQLADEGSAARGLAGAQVSAGGAAAEPQPGVQVLDEASYPGLRDEVWRRLPPARQQARIVRLRVWSSVAAAVVLALGTWMLWPAHPKAPAVVIHYDAAPGGNKAVLTLGNGQQIALDSSANGELAVQGGVHVVKTRDGLLAYATGGKDRRTLLFNTLSTPKGGTYRITLADGTKVTLDAASSITYPVTFGQGSRKVTITGEVYFEVAQQRSHPFEVTANGQIVDVLGTSFNVNAYSDEQAVVTTLVDGSVKVRAGAQAVVLKPGQQAMGEALTVRQANISEVTAWKNGIFQFEDADLKTVLRQLARWYDVQIAYEGKVPYRTFTGKISRDIKASEALDILKFSKVHFRIEDKKIVVTP